jgi:hypothetical protein
MNPILFLALMAQAAPVPADDPLSRYKLGWTGEIRWSSAVRISDFKGDTALDRLRAAQEAVASKGGGVIYFPPGVYEFTDSILLKDGVLLRGADPKGVTDARDERYDPPTRFEFPRYRPVFEGSGTPLDTAFKGIFLEAPATASNCGVVNVSVQRGSIHLGGRAEREAGRNRIVAGCVLRNAAAASREIPDLAIGQHPWQRYTDRFHAAIHVNTSENSLIASNRIPESGEESFLMRGYVLLDRKKEKTVPPPGVLFDMDNRPGIAANDYGIGGAGGEGPDGTPKTHPHGFRKGIVIRENFIFATGRCAITFTGDGVYCGFNVIRFKPGVVRWTTTGRHLVGGTGTNDNRAVQMRGWRWTVEGNDYEVHRNKAADSGYEINDGEGLMHEDHVNSTVLDSRLIGNKGNTYLSIYKTGGIDGLLVQGNDIRTAGGIAAIYVVANRNKSRHECRNVRIVGNTTAGGGISIGGDPAENNLVKDNRHVGGGGKLVNGAQAKLENNEGYVEGK